jgi:hypothetical protein
MYIFICFTYILKINPSKNIVELDNIGLFLLEKVQLTFDLANMQFLLALPIAHQTDLKMSC